MKNTLLFGNGINQLSHNSINWTELLEKLKREKFANKTLPNTMIYERVLMERNGNNKGTHFLETEIKNDIAKYMHEVPTNEYYEKIFDLEFDDYLTTNYDYAFKNKLKEKGLSSLNKSTEGIYSIRRKTTIHDNDTVLCNIWNIHGEINKPTSIMLGLDHYCGSIGKLDGYIKGTYEFQENREPYRVKSIVHKLKNNIYDNHSWVELFFNSNIHIVGLSLDYSETDLWWILNKRARIMTDEKKSVKLFNEIYYYTNFISEEKKGLLESFNVKVIVDEVENQEWNKHYDRILEKINMKASH